MFTALLTVENLFGAEHDIWAVNVEEEYHEEASASWATSTRAGKRGSSQRPPPRAPLGEVDPVRPARLGVDRIAAEQARRRAAP